MVLHTVDVCTRGYKTYNKTQRKNYVLYLSTQTFKTKYLLRRLMFREFFDMHRAEIIVGVIGAAISIGLAIAAGTSPIEAGHKSGRT